MNLLPSLPEFNQVLSIASPAKLVRGVGQSFADVLRSATENAPAAAPQASAAPAAVGDGSARLAAQQQLAASLAMTPDKQLSLDDLRTQAEQVLATWEQVFAERLSDAGVDLNQGFSLSVRPGDGRLVVGGNHPDKEKIEAILAEDSPLSRSIRSINTTMELVQAGERYREFSAAYEQDPVAAVTNFRHLFESSFEGGIDFWIDQYGARASLV